MSGERACTAQARLRFAPPPAVREPCVVVRDKGRGVVRGAWHDAYEIVGDSAGGS
ncbi:MAG: hypothetical protein LBD24_01160 [Spirochaetaceae bacterium]|nr:hypothetical protein [Spirochaetaceae bacterium]